MDHNFIRNGSGRGSGGPFHMFSVVSLKTICCTILKTILLTFLKVVAVICDPICVKSKVFLVAFNERLTFQAVLV